MRGVYLLNLEGLRNEILEWMRYKIAGQFGVPPGDVEHRWVRRDDVLVPAFDVQTKAGKLSAEEIEQDAAAIYRVALKMLRGRMTGLKERRRDGSQEDAIS